MKLEYQDADLARDEPSFRSIEGQIKRLVTQLPHVGSALPASWIGIRDEIMGRRTENHITVAQFKEICRTHQITEEEDQLAICGYLNTLGILLHFRNDASLADTVFVNPEWLSEAVYVILADKDIERHSGCFSKERLFDKWGRKYSFEVKNKLLTLMQKQEFDLIYQVESDDTATQRFIAPLLLSDVAPDAANSWDRRGALAFQYRYKFMPLGIVTRLIVRLNLWIAQRDGVAQVWKSGVILEKDGCVALVKKDLSNDGVEIIDISVRGEMLQAKDFLGHIRATIDAVHRQSFKDVEAELLVPCTCKLCQTDATPTMFELSRLRKYISVGDFKIRCEMGAAFRDVPIADLLGGIFERRHDPGPREGRDWRGHRERFPELDQLTQTVDALTDALREQTQQAIEGSEKARRESPWPKRLTVIGTGVGILIGLGTLYTLYTKCIAEPSRANAPPERARTTSPQPNSETQGGPGRN